MKQCETCKRTDQMGVLFYNLAGISQCIYCACPQVKNDIFLGYLEKRLKFKEDVYKAVPDNKFLHDEYSEVLEIVATYKTYLYNLHNYPDTDFSYLSEPIDATQCIAYHKEEMKKVYRAKSVYDLIADKRVMDMLKELKKVAEY